MAILKTIVVEDSKVDQLIIEKLIKGDPDLVNSATFNNAIEALSCIKALSPDIVFLDIEMPGMNGIDFITAIDNVPIVIVISSHRKYALDAYENDVVDFILKPLDKGRFEKAITKAKQLFEWLSLDDEAGDSIFIRVNRENVKIMINDITHIEAMADYVRVFTDQKYMVLCSMKSISSKLPKNQFVRVHRSLIINADKVTSFDSGTVSMESLTFQISRNGKVELKKVMDLKAGS